MSKESRQRLREAAKSCESRRRNCLTFVSFLFVFAFIAAFVFMWRRYELVKSQEIGGSHVANFTPPRGLAELCKVATDELEQCDIALMNLLCTERLRGAESLDLFACLERLDGLAKYVKSETDRHYYKFREHPAEFDHSEGYFRMMMLVTVLQQDLGIHYNPERARLPLGQPETSDKFFVNSQDVFIHGLVREGGAGTCSSMPVFLVSVGRRPG